MTAQNNALINKKYSEENVLNRELSSEGHVI
jgi:hypothetical protein